MTSRVLYVFNSGVRNRYRENLLVALAAPPRATYKVSYNKERNVSDRALDRLGQMKLGDPMMLVFIDRYTDGAYQFVPVRRATYLRHQIDSGRVDIEMLLADWPEVSGEQDFSSWASSSLVPLGAPQKVTDGRPQDQDGDYAVVGPETPSDMFTGEDGWLTTARRLSQCAAFKDTADERVVFARLDIQDATNVGKIIGLSQRLTSKIEACYRAWFGRPARRIRFQGGRTFTARVTYLFPAQATDPNATVPYRMHFAGGLVALHQLNGIINAEQRADTFDFISPDLARGPCSIGVTFGEGKVMAPRLDLIGEFSWSPALLFVGAVIGALWILGSGYAAQLASDSGAFRWGYYVTATMEYVALLLMFWFFGIKPN